MISSVTEPSISRVMSSLTRRSSGPTPSMGLMAPPSTWYLPRNSRVRSIATTSLGSSTTQMTSSERRGSRQILHCSPSATLKQVLQKRTSACTRCSAAISRPTSALSAASRWKAMRWALLGPTPGSRPSSSMRSWTAPSYTVGSSSSACAGKRGLEAGQAHATAEAAGQRAHAARGQLVRGALGVADGGDDEVLQGLQVVGVDGGRRNGQGGELAAAGHGGGDQVASGRAGDLGARELLLRRDQLLLHLLGLLEQLRHVGLASGEHAPSVGRRTDTGRDTLIGCGGGLCWERSPSCSSPAARPVTPRRPRRSRRPPGCGRVHPRSIRRRRPLPRHPRGWWCSIPGTTAGMRPPRVWSTLRFRTATAGPSPATPPERPPT